MGNDEGGLGIWGATIRSTIRVLKNLDVVLHT